MDPADPVQPEGQGGAGTPDAPYREYLDRIPEELRGQIEPVFKDWDANVTRRFQEHSEFRKQWEPYEPLGVNQLSPDEVAWALQFRQAAVQNPEAIKEWYSEYAQQHGLTAAEAAQVAQAAQEPDLYGLDPSVTAFKQQLEPIQQQLEQMNRWRAQQEEAARIAEAQAYINGQMTELESKHPDEWNQAAVEKLVANYIETDPQHAVQRAFADWQTIRSQIEKDTLQSKVNAPPPAESGGTVNAVPEEIKTLADANRIALERIRQSRAA